LKCYNDVEKRLAIGGIKIYLLLNTNRKVKPILKWAGGKRKLLPELMQRVPEEYNCYYEPFVGGGSLLFQLLPEKAVINDANTELVNLYQVIKNNPHALIEDMKKHKNNEEYFYTIRKMDRDDETFSKLSDVEKASRILYLNKTCYNGLFRMNRSHHFNSPFGRYKNPKILDEETILGISDYFNKSSIEIMTADFEVSLKKATKTDFVYLDPPYDPVSETANFTTYDGNEFGKSEQIRLKKCCDALDKRGVKFLESNSATDFILEQYQGYHIDHVLMPRMINSNAKKRGKVEEVLIRNYE